MANEGMLVTFAVSMLGCAAYALAARQVARSPGHRRNDVLLFCVAASLYLLLAGGRLLFGYLGAHGVDHAMFLMVGTPAFLSVVPLVHAMARVISGNPIAVWVTTGLSTAGALGGLIPFYIGGIVGPEVTYWATEYRFGLPIAGKMLFNAVLLPALAASVVMILVGTGLSGSALRRALAFGFSTLAFFASLTSDGLALSGGFLIIERAIMAGAALLVYVTYGSVGESQPSLESMPPLPPGNPPRQG